MYKVGDKVKIKNYDEIKKSMAGHMGPGFSSGMIEYTKKTAKIVDIYDQEIEWFHLDIDGRTWVWDAKWLEKLNIIQMDSNLFEI